MKYPAYIPHPIAWLKAIVLFLFLECVWRFFSPGLEHYSTNLLLQGNSPANAIPVLILAILSPIGFIGVTHYLLHLLLGALSSKIQSPRVKLNPALFSLWEGLWGWAVMAVSLLVIVFIVGIIPGMAQTILTSRSPDILLQCLWVVVTAFLYQVEYSVEKCTSVHRGNNSASPAPRTTPPGERK